MMIKKNVDEAANAKKRLAEGKDEAEKAKKAKTDTFQPDEAMKQVILKDIKNSKLWKECLEFVAETQLEWLDNVEAQFNCICCTELLYKPITTGCGHSLCQTCFKRAIKADCKNCPHCRTPFEDDLDINQECANALLALFPGYDAERK